jgi:hypothetical protein
MKVYMRIIAILIVAFALAGVGMSVSRSMAASPGHSRALCVTQCVGASHEGQVANLRVSLATPPILPSTSVLPLAKADILEQRVARRALVGEHPWPVDYVTLNQTFLD